MQERHEPVAHSHTLVSCKNPVEFFTAVPLVMIFAQLSGQRAAMEEPSVGESNNIQNGE